MHILSFFIAYKSYLIKQSKMYKLIYRYLETYSKTLSTTKNIRLLLYNIALVFIKKKKINC